MKKFVLLIALTGVIAIFICLPSFGQISYSYSTSSSGFVLGVNQANSQGNPFLSTVYSQFNIHWTRTGVSLSSSWKTGVYDVLVSDGYNILGILDGGTLVSGGSNWGLSDWDSAVSQAVKAYPGIHAWEVWNEPEVTTYENGYLCCRANENQLADHYFNMLRDAYNIIHAAAPSDMVLGPSVTIYTYGDVLDSYSLSLTQQIWALGGAKYSDAASIHMYTQGHMFNTVLQNGQTVQQFLSAGLNTYENILKKPIWITETGYSTSSNSVQNTFLTQEMGLISTKSFVKGLFWYDVTDWPKSTTGYGLWSVSSTGPNHSFSPRTAAYTFSQYETKL